MKNRTIIIIAIAAIALYGAYLYMQSKANADASKKAEQDKSPVPGFNSFGEAVMFTNPLKS